MMAMLLDWDDCDVTRLDTDEAANDFDPRATARMDQVEIPDARPTIPRASASEQVWDDAVEVTCIGDMLATADDEDRKLLRRLLARRMETPDEGDATEVFAVGPAGPTVIQETVPSFKTSHVRARRADAEVPNFRKTMVGLSIPTIPGTTEDASAVQMSPIVVVEHGQPSPPPATGQPIGQRYAQSPAQPAMYTGPGLPPVMFAISAPATPQPLTPGERKRSQERARFAAGLCILLLIAIATGVAVWFGAPML